MKRLAWVWVLAAGCVGFEETKDDEALDQLEDANALYAAGRYAEAVPKYEFVLTWRDRILEAYHRLADCHERLGRPEEAINVLVRARRIDSVNGTTLRALGRLNAAAGHTADAVEVYAKIVELFPGDEGARTELARLRALGK